MKSAIKITVSAFITSPDGDAEKSASGVVEIGDGAIARDWIAIMGSLVQQAVAHGPDDFPLEGATLMTPEQVEEYLDKQDAG